VSAVRQAAGEGREMLSEIRKLPVSPLRGREDGVAGGAIGPGRSDQRGGRRRQDVSKLVGWGGKRGKRFGGRRGGDSVQQARLSKKQETGAAPT